MKKTERIGFLSANDEKRPTGSTTRTPFAKWGRAGVDSLLDLLLPSDRSEELLGLGINISKRKIYVHLPNKTPSVAPPLLHGTERSAFTQERKTVRLRSVARYIGPRESTLAHNISFERSSYGSPSRIRYHLKLRSTSYCEHAYETLVGRSGHDRRLRRAARASSLRSRGRSWLYFSSLRRRFAFSRFLRTQARQEHSDQHTRPLGEAEEASERQAPVALGL